MKINIGSLDRVSRIIIGVVILTLTALHIIGPWGWLAIGFIVSGVFKFCPAYSFLGIHTRKK
jgi:hypothetical protein